jgi:hypothetical protein
MSSYNFTKEISILLAFDNYMKYNNSPLYDGSNLSGFNLNVLTTSELNSEQIVIMNQLVNEYIEAPYYLDLTRTESTTLHSHYTSDSDLVQSNNKSVVQTLIFNNINEDSGDLLNCVKTVLEYNTPNLQNFINITSGSIDFEIYDITRDYLIFSDTIDISSITNNWNTLAQTGSTSGNNTVYKSFMCTGLLDKTTDYDCIWQFRMATSSPNFNARMNGLQYLFYNKIDSEL